MLKVTCEPCLAAKHKGFAYQVAAVEAIQKLEYAAVFHEQGLGKTKIGVDLSLLWLATDVVDSILIVTKKSLVQNWRTEIWLHTYIEPRVLDQDRRGNFYGFNSPARLYVTHYEVLRSEAKRFVLFLKTRRVAVILDEAQKIKNPDAALTKVNSQRIDTWRRTTPSNGQESSVPFCRRTSMKLSCLRCWANIT